MKVVMMVEWDLPKDEAVWKKYIEASEKSATFWQKRIETGVVKEAESWADNTGHIIAWIVFESGDAYAKLWDDEEFHRLAIEFSKTVDDAKIRLLRPGIPL